MKKVKVFFVVHKRRLNFGSTELRVFQLARMLEKEKGRDLEINVSPLPTRRKWIQQFWSVVFPKGSIVVFSKASLSSLSNNCLRALRLRGVKTCIDYVDSDLRRLSEFDADVHIMASHRAMALAAEILQGSKLAKASSIQRLMLVHHNVDTRIPQIDNVDERSLRTIYLGDVLNAFRTKNIEDVVTFLNISRAEDMLGLLDAVRKANFHYCIRERTWGDGELIAKPFTKGFVASRLGSPVIVDVSEDDAVQFLGDDYPFLVRGKSEEAVMSVMDDARSNIGGFKWRDAKERVLAMRSVFSPATISSQFMEIVEVLS